MFAAGNEYQIGDDVNYEGYLNSRFTISVGGARPRPQALFLLFSGAPVFISAPGGDTDEYGMIAALPLALSAVDNRGNVGVGTSYAAPLVSGVVALVLEANPSLTWRDVQGVLAATAQTDFNDEDDETGQWTTNQAGVKHSYKHGFACRCAGRDGGGDELDDLGRGADEHDADSERRGPARLQRN